MIRICSAFRAPEGSLGQHGMRFDPVGGMQNHTAQLARALDRRGIEQIILTAYRHGAPRSERLGVRGRVLRLGVNTHRCRQLYGTPAALLASRFARQADLVHAHLGEDIAVLPMALLAARLHRRPLVVTVHTSPKHTLRGLDGRTRLVQALGGPIEHWIECRADAVIVLSSRVRRLLAEAGVDPERVVAIPSGVDPSLFAGPHADPFPGARRPRVIFVGRLVRPKGADVLVEAAARLSAPAEVLLVGDGPERSALERLVDDFRLGHRVRFHGFMPHHRVAAALAHADVLVLPSRYEELGSILVEALQAGVPVVASRTGGIPEVVRDLETGLLVAPEDAGALASAIDRLLGDDALRRSMAVASRRYAAEYDWEHLSAAVLRVYEQVLAARTPRLVDVSVAPG